jgi:hypothetical protein
MKQIKISGCHECDKRHTSCGIWLIVHAVDWVESYVDSETIHPDCPLDDVEEQGGWIRVEDRLPEEGQRVLCVVKLLHSTFIDMRNYHNNTMNHPITHWQPLPSPPKDKPKEGK